MGDAAPVLLPNYTVDDWQHWEGKWELIQGVPHAMSPSPNLPHQRVAGNAHVAFSNALQDCEDCYASQPADYKISNNTIFIPDMLVLCGEQEGQFVNGTPALLLEVLSKSTASKDRLVKFHYYQQQGIPYYLIVDVKKRRVEVYELQDGEYEKTFDDETGTYDFTFEGTCRARIDFALFWRLGTGK